jgi:anti-sigma B factor antagonist
MPEDDFPVEVVGGVPVVAAPEEIDITNAEALRSALLTAAAGGPGTLVVDMTQTQFCDSSGLHTLLAAHKQAGAEGRQVVLVIPSTAVLRVFAITGVDRMIPNFTSLAEALAQTAATANGRGASEMTEMPRSPVKLPVPLSAPRIRPRRRSPERVYQCGADIRGKETGRSARRTPSSRRRSRTAASTGSRKQTHRGRSRPEPVRIGHQGWLVISALWVRLRSCPPALLLGLLLSGGQRPTA